MFTTLSVALSILLVGFGFAASASDAVGPEKSGQDPSQTCIGGKDGVKEELFRASQDAAKRIVDSYSSGKEFNPKDVRLVKAAKTACLSADVRRSAESMISSNEKRIKRELLEAARETGNRVLANYNSSDGDLEFKSSDLRTFEIFQNVLMAADCLQRVKMPQQSAKTDSGQAGKALEAAGRVIAAFNQDGWNVDFNANDLETLKAFQKAARAP
jgi:hypothetical protein